MKKHIYIFIISGLLVCTPGCTDWLDLQPESEVVLDEFWQSETQATEVMIACYRSLIEEASMNRMIAWGEIRSDNTVEGNGPSSDLLKILDEDITSTNGYANWASMYQTINYCNTFLYYAPAVMDVDVNFTLGKYQALEAEVLAIRALCYFYLIRAYKEVPLILEPSIDDTQDYNLAKASERDILDQIISDLVKAEINARRNFVGEDFPKARINKNMINSLLADIYLWDQQYDKCVSACDKVLEDEDLELVKPSFMLYNVFNIGSSEETIFELPFDGDVSKNWAVRNLYGYFAITRGRLYFPVFLAESGYSPFNLVVGAGKESENDYRFSEFINNTDKSKGSYYIFKYAGLMRLVTTTGASSYLYSSTSPVWVVYRMSDVLLMKAEALVQLNRSENDLKDALKLVNTTYLRSNIDEGVDSLQFNSYSSPLQMEELVLRERQREFLFEGKRWFDLVRIARRDNSTARVKNYVSPKFSGSQTQTGTKLSVLDALYWPIPQEEIERNSNLVQNPYYELSASSSSK